MAHPPLAVAMLIVLQQAGVLRNSKMELIPHPFHDAVEVPPCPLTFVIVITHSGKILEFFGMKFETFCVV